jgi:signal peptidase II
MKKYKKHIWCAVMIILIVAFDQITKYLVTLNLKGKPSVTFIPGVVQFNYAENTGMAFSMLSGARWMFIVLTSVVCAAGLWYLFSGRCKNLWEYWSIGVVISGGFGNLIDRFAHNYVVDFIEPTFINFAVFNIADSAVTLGAISLAAYLVYDAFRHKGEKNG